MPMEIEDVHLAFLEKQHVSFHLRIFETTCIDSVVIGNFPRITSIMNILGLL
jgi:hypothetical protein